MKNILPLLLPILTIFTNQVHSASAIVETNSYEIKNFQGTRDLSMVCGENQAWL